MVRVSLTKTGKRFIDSDGMRGECFSFGQFDNEFKNICHIHHNEGRALVFAFIINNFEHPHIAKTLKDKDYWAALDSIAGNFLTVFSFHWDPILGGRKDPISKKTFLRLTDSYRFLSKQFGTNLPTENPFILFFQVIDDEIYDPRIVIIRAETIEKSFIEIKMVLSAAVESLEKVEPEFRGNKKEIFDLVAQTLSQQKAVRAITKAVGIAGSIHDFIGKLKSF